MTKNEAMNLPHCLPPITSHFDDVHVVDSNSTDDTVDIATQFGAQVTNFTWNEQYPKKKQWCLDNIVTNYEWILMIDADEVVTPQFIKELKNTKLTCDGYFIKSDMVWHGKHLRHGQKNNKLCLFKKSFFAYPVIDDLDIDGGWEVEGHYQPVARTKRAPKIGQIKSSLLHHDRKEKWHDRHDKYVSWEVEMTHRDIWPIDPVFIREFIKEIIRGARLRPHLYFVYGYVLKLGFLDGKMGLDYALNRYHYNVRIVRAIQQTNASH